MNCLLMQMLTIIIRMTSWMVKTLRLIRLRLYVLKHTTARPVLINWLRIRHRTSVVIMWLLMFPDSWKSAKLLWRSWQIIRNRFTARSWKNWLIQLQVSWKVRRWKILVSLRVSARLLQEHQMQEFIRSHSLITILQTTTKFLTWTVNILLSPLRRRLHGIRKAWST